MGTTRIKVIDLSSDEKEIKTSRKHAEKLTGAAKLKGEKKPKKEVSKGPKGKEGQEEKEGLEGKEERTIQAATEETSAPSQPSEPSQPSTPSEPSKPSQPSVPRHLHHKGHKYLAAKAKLEKGKRYPVKEAIALLGETSTVKFDPTVELHLNVVDKNIKGTISLPHPVGVAQKEKRYLVFSDKKPATTEIAETEQEDTEKKPVDSVKPSRSIKRGSPTATVSLAVARNIIWGDDKTIAEIENGQLKPGRDFDAVYATPQFMPKIAKIAKILGPAGLMPNPKNKTVTENVEKALKTKDEGFALRCEQQAAVIHTKVGKLSAKSEDLEENLKALIFAIGPQKIKKATLSSTMSPGIRLDIASFSAK